MVAVIYIYILAELLNSDGWARNRPVQTLKVLVKLRSNIKVGIRQVSMFCIKLFLKSESGHPYGYFEYEMF